MPEVTKQQVATYVIRTTAAPTFYTGLLGDGRRFQVYYRYGSLRVSVSQAPNILAQLSDAERRISAYRTILERQCGDQYSSSLEHEEVVALTRAALIWDNAVEIPYQEYIAVETLDA